MIHLEAFQEFRSGLAFLRGGDAIRALPHLRSALDHEPSNPFYISYVGVAVAAAEQRWAEAEKLCHSAMRMNRRQHTLPQDSGKAVLAGDSSALRSGRVFPPPPIFAPPPPPQCG